MTFHFKSFRSQAMRRIEMRCAQEEDVAEQGVSGSANHWTSNSCDVYHAGFNHDSTGGPMNTPRRILPGNV